MTTTPSSASGRRKLLLAAAVLAIAGGELAARAMGFGDPPLVILDDKIEYYLAPGRSYTRFGHTIRVNRQGMRSDELGPSDIGGLSSFSLLGDSVVYGHRLDQPSTLPALLQEILRNQSKLPRPIVNSIAASSWGPENILEFYKRFGPFPGNVAWIVQSTHDMVDVTHQVNAPPLDRSVAPYGALHDLALSAWSWVGKQIRRQRSDPEPLEQKRRRADAALHALISLLKADYVRVILVFHATRGEAVAGQAAGLAHFRAMAQVDGIDFISTLELYQNAYASHRPPHADAIHLSSGGAQLLAKQLAEAARLAEPGQ